MKVFVVLSTGKLYLVAFARIGYTISRSLLIDLSIVMGDNLVFHQSHSHSMNKDNKIISHKAIQKHLQTYLEPMLLDKAQNTDVSWVMAMVKDEVFKAVIVHTRGNQTKAAKLLGISRSNFAVKIKDTASQRQGR